MHVLKGLVGSDRLAESQDEPKGSEFASSIFPNGLVERYIFNEADNFLVQMNELWKKCQTRHIDRKSRGVTIIWIRRFRE